MPRWRRTTARPSCRRGPSKPRDKAKVEVAVQVATRWIIAKLRNRRFFSLAELERGHPRAGHAAQRPRDAASGREPASACSRRWSARRSSRCRPSPTSTPNGRNAGSGSTITSRSRSTTTRCRTRCCARRCGRGSRRAPSRSSIAASALPRMCARPPNRQAHDGARAHAVEPPALRRLDAGADQAAGRRDRAQHLGADRDHPARALAPRAGLPRLRSASCGSSRAMAASGSRRPVAGRWRSARAPTPPSTRS